MSADDNDLRERLEWTEAQVRAKTKRLDKAIGDWLGLSVILSHVEQALGLPHGAGIAVGLREKRILSAIERLRNAGENAAVDPYTVTRTWETE